MTISDPLGGSHGSGLTLPSGGGAYVRSSNKVRRWFPGIVMKAAQLLVCRVQRDALCTPVRIEQLFESGVLTITAKRGSLILPPPIDWKDYPGVLYTLEIVTSSGKVSMTIDHKGHEQGG